MRNGRHEIVTDCDCVGPGVCDRHGCTKTPHWYQLCRTRADYFRLWEEGRGPGQSRQPDSSPRRERDGSVFDCRHRGAVVRTALGSDESGARTVTLHECRRHGHCHTVDGVRVRDRVDGRDATVCSRCRDRQPSRSTPHVGPLHVYFHVWPLRTGADVWRWNIDQLRQRLELFNGRRIVGIATSSDAEPPEAVERELAGCDCEFVVRPNDSDLREVATMTPALARLRDEPGATLVSHAKGVTRSSEAVRRWSRLCWALCCDHPERVVRGLERFPLVGPFRKRHGFDKPPPRGWHYHGGFYWFRNDAVAQRNAVPESAWHGSESFPGRWFEPSEGGVFLFDLAQGDLLYGHLSQRLQERYETWRRTRDRSHTSSSTI